MRIGMVVAVEIDAVLERYGEPQRMEKHGEFTVRVYNVHGSELIIAHSGVGEISAAACTQLLISVYGAEMILNFGVVGGLTEEMSKTTACVVEKVVHYDFDCEAIDGTAVGQYAGFPDVYIPTDERLRAAALRIAPELKQVICASGDKFVADREKKEALHERFGADICEMESAGIALTSFRNKVPCLLIKTVSDGISGGAEEYLSEVRKTSAVCLSVADMILEEGL
ncbi:MAG: 5'-methylthioadenosine/S-adenosylhomocysteine nucleosidase [Lachnospiraceae bacterium]|nr:5'-methylthioadenosine/S-adenosylhomocysteine nucleosidase [Lachnospiraceae bacterium]